MRFSLPLSGLIKFNVTLSLAVAILMFLFLSALEHDFLDTIFRALEVFIFNLIASFINVTLLGKLVNKSKCTGLWSNLNLYVVSNVLAICLWVILTLLYSVVTMQQWEGAVEQNRVKAYGLGILAVCCFNMINLIIQHFNVLQFSHAQMQIDRLHLKANVADANNLLLKEQIQPHFLFNALSTVKSLYAQDNNLGEEYLIQLANFLRMSISNHNKNLVLVGEELEFSVTYLRMQKIRFEDAVYFKVDLSERSLRDMLIPHFSLQTLVENVLKHNKSTPQDPLYIEIYECRGWIVVRNNIQPLHFAPQSIGNGLYNLTERYKLLDVDEPKIVVDNNKFTISLKMIAK